MFSASQSFFCQGANCLVDTSCIENNTKTACIYVTAQTLEDVIRWQWQRQPSQNTDRNTLAMKEFLPLTCIGGGKYSFIGWPDWASVDAPGRVSSQCLHTAIPQRSLFMKKTWFISHQTHTVWDSPGQKDWNHYWWFNTVWLTLLMSCLSGKLPCLQMWCYHGDETAKLILG